MTTQLPEPNFIERDPDKITKEWIALYEQKSGKTLQPAQIERLIIDIGAYRETVLRMKIQETAKQNLLSYAPLEILEHIGEPLGISKLLADCSKTNLKFSLDEPLASDLIIPMGTEVEAKDGLFVFQTTESVVISAGSLYVLVDAVCETSGAASNNYAIGTINNLLSQINYITQVENTVVSHSGADDEDAENLRERIRQAPEKFSNAGSRGAYKAHTLSAHQNIIDVAVLSPSPGVVEVYPLTVDGVCDNEVIDIVQNYLNDDKIRPLTDYVIVKPPEKITFSIDADILLYTNADAVSVMKTIDAKLNEYKILLSEKLGKDVIQTQIISILNTVYGVFKVDIKTPSDINILDYQWADLVTFNVRIGGYANE